VCSDLTKWVVDKQQEIIELLVQITDMCTEFM
jgi:hypothetical protein